MSIIADLFALMTGSLGAGLPSLVVIAIPLIVGLIIGFVLRKALKIGIILVVVALVASYLGFISLASVEQGAKDLATKYGPIAMSYVAIFFGIIPLSIGLVIGVIIGFIV
jgi:uncharacterized membrane protein (Fun14 family)